MPSIIKILKNRKKALFHKKKNRQRHLYPRRNLLEGAPRGDAIVLEKVSLEAKQPNSAKRKCVKVRLKKNGARTTAFLMGEGVNQLITENCTVTLEGIKRGNSPYGDIPSVRWKVVAISGISVLKLLKDRKKSSRKP